MNAVTLDELLADFRRNLVFVEFVQSGNEVTHNTMLFCKNEQPGPIRSTKQLRETPHICYRSGAVEEHLPFAAERS